MEKPTAQSGTPKCPKCKAPMIKLSSYNKPLQKDALEKKKQLTKLSDYFYAQAQIWICDKCLIMGLWLD